MARIYPRIDAGRRGGGPVSRYPGEPVTSGLALESHGSSDGVREWNPSMEVLAFLLAIQVKINII